MAEYKNGAENVPIRDFNTSTPIKIFVIDLRNDDNVVKEVELDYGKSEDRKYLGKLTFWAIQNGHSIETMSVKNANGDFS